MAQLAPVTKLKPGKHSRFGVMETIKDFEAQHCEHAKPYKPENEQIQVRAEDQALIRRKVCMASLAHLPST